MIYHDVIWWVFFSIIPLIFLQNALHEVSHGLCVLPFGWGFRIYPFFHWYNITTGEYRFSLTRPTSIGIWGWYFARVETFRNINARELPKYLLVLFYIAPRITNTIIVVVLFVLNVLLTIPSSMQTFLMLFCICQVIDGFVGIMPLFYANKQTSMTDVWQYQRLTEAPIWYLRIQGMIWLCVLLFLLVLPIH